MYKNVYFMPLSVLAKSSIETWTYVCDMFAMARRRLLAPSICIGSSEHAAEPLAFGC